MRYSTMERYRRAALTLRRRGLQPTMSAVAQLLRVRKRHVHDIMSKHPELRAYAGIVSSRDAKIARYNEAVRELIKRGHHVSAKLVADELEISLSALNKFAARNGSSLSSNTPLLTRSEKVQAEYHAAARRLQAQGLLVTRKALAHELDKKIGTVNQYLHANPQFAQELGVVYTDQVHGRAKNSREKA